MIAFARRDPADGFAAWSSTAFGAVYVGLLGAVAILTTQWTGPASFERVFWPERRWILVLLAGVWSFDTGAYLVGRAIGRRPFLPWISPKKTLEGVLGGLVVATRGCRRRPRDQRQLPAGGARPGPAPRRRRPVRRPRRVAPQARRRREGLRHAAPRARRDPRPGRLDPLRRAGPRRLGGPRPWLSRPAPAAGRSRRAPRAPAARSARRPSTSSPASPRTGGSSRSRRARRRPCSRSRRAGCGRRRPRSARTRRSTCRPAAPRCGGPTRSRRSRRATTWTSWSSGRAASSACGRSWRRCGPARSSRRRTRRRSSPAGTW